MLKMTQTPGKTYNIEGIPSENATTDALGGEINSSVVLPDDPNDTTAFVSQASELDFSEEGDEYFYINAEEEVVYRPQIPELEESIAVGLPQFYYEEQQAPNDESLANNEQRTGPIKED